jgi:UDP-GlcNAc3NAcA epimerase
MKKLPKILAIVGARPQFIKHAPLLGNQRWKDKLDIVSLHTGQHYDENMSGIFFNQLGIPKPEYQLTIGSGNHGEQTGKMMIEIEKVCIDDEIDGMVVYGDTNSTLAGALVASKLHIPVFHIEAGLRSFDKKMPEEINRILTDHVSELLFIPTENARVNLKNEGANEEKVVNVGDLMLEAHRFFGKHLSSHTSTITPDKKFALITIHRAENTNSRERMDGITKILSNAGKYMDIVVPLHPRTRKYLTDYGLLDLWEKEFDIIDPIGYIEMLDYELKAQIIITDSGGVQKEAFFSETPCITVRDSTEWTELIDCGANRLLNPVDDVDIDLQEIIKKKVDYTLDLYGTGSSSSTIIENLEKYYS